ncbi:MAG: hypothetical protein ACT6FB_04345 [Methanosarcinaceae archaeon]
MKGILAILMASVMVAAMIAPAMGDIASTDANVSDLESSYDCSETSISNQPDPVTPSAGTVNYNLVVSDDNGGDTIPDDTWTAEVDFGDGTQNDTLTLGAANGLQRTCTGTGSIPVNTAAGTYTVTFKLDTTTVCTTTVTVTSVAAYVIDFNTVTYGSINPGASSTVSGDDTMGTNNSPTIENKGNIVMDVNISISDGSNPEILFESNTQATVGGVGPQILTTTATTFDVDIVVGGKAKIDTTLSVPTGIKAGIYSGTITVTGIIG